MSVMNLFGKREVHVESRVAFFILSGLRVQPPLDSLDPFSYTLKLTNGSDQNFMDPLNFTRQGMPKFFAELLTPKIVIVNTKKHLVNEQIMTQKTKKSSSGGQHSELWTP